MAFSLIFTSFSLTCQSVFIAFEKLEYYAYATVGANLAFLLLCVTLLSQGCGITALAIGYVGYRLCEAVWHIILLRLASRVSIKSSLLDFQYAKAILRSGMTFLILNVFVVLYNKVDVLTLAKIQGEADAGIYVVAYRFLEIFLIVITAFNEALLPVFSRLFESSRPSFNTLIESSSKYLFLLVLPIVLTVVLLADRLIGNLFPKDFMSSVWPLRILMLSLIPWFLRPPLTRAIIASNNQKVLIRVTGISLVVNVLLNLLLIPRLSYVGAAISSVVAVSSAMIQNLLFVKRNLHDIDYKRVLFKPTLAALAFCISVFAIRGLELWFIALLPSLLMYIAFLILFKAFDAQDALLLRNFFSQRGR
jgi:O-antigen/teichoic acid export membrane protein